MPQKEAFYLCDGSEKPQDVLINFFTVHITWSLKPFVNEYGRELPE